LPAHLSFTVHSGRIVAVFLNKIKPLFNNIKLLFTFCKQNLNIFQIFCIFKNQFSGQKPAKGEFGCDEGLKNQAG
jgi:hypothetical protein